MRRTQVGTAHRGLEIRQACPADYAGIQDFLEGLSLRARYLRFFTGALSANPAMLRLLAGGGDRSDAIVAIENGVIIGHAMAGDTTGPGGSRVTEIGVVVTDACQGRGIGSALVRMLTARAQARGVTAATMEVLAENRQVLTMIANRWPAARHDHSGAYITIHARLPQPADRAQPADRRRPADRRQPAGRRLRQPGEERPSERLAIPR